MSELWVALRSVLPLVGVVLGFVLGQTATFIQTERARRRHRDALRAELDLCERDARAYLEPGAPWAPLYRLPTFVFPVSFPPLLGRLNERDVKDLVACELLIQEINRGLDSVHRALEAKDKDESRISAEVSRLHLKCDKLVNPHGDDGNEEAYVARARRALALPGWGF